MQEATPANDSITERVADVGGVKLQYLTAGHGPAIVLLHGYAETSRMWKLLMPKLSSNFTVIAPDLPGIGGSDVPRDGLDMTHAAIRIHDLVKQLGIAKAQVVGHDIGLMVAYGYAAQHTDGLAIASLVIGIISIVCSIGSLGIVLGPTAAIMGFISRQRIATSGGAVGGGALAIVGLVLGILGFVTSVGAFFFWIFASNFTNSIAQPTP